MSAAAEGAPICKIEVLTCKDQKDRLLKLQANARAQLSANRTEFDDPYPWDFNFCEFLPEAVHLVAFTEDHIPIICGWVLLESDTFKFGKTLEIAGITTRRKRMGSQRIGKMFHDAIVAYGRAQGKDMIFLHAKDSKVAEIYAKWGYIQIVGTKEIASLDLPSDIPADKMEEYKGHVERMMAFPLRDDFVIGTDFKNMVKKDAHQMTQEGYYGGNYRREYKGGSRRRTRRNRRSRRLF
jgi:hypothetical protein